MDGIVFIDPNDFYNEVEIDNGDYDGIEVVRWTITIPNANLRNASEFTEDLTLSMWVDWNKDDAWGVDEVVIRDHLNISEHFPTNKETMKIQYYSVFELPPEVVDGGASQAPLRTQSPNKWWVRGVLSYDDPDVWPNGEQLFGDVEDYRIRLGGD
jgi:hypothetical protein